jgi:hypothetical protein
MRSPMERAAEAAPNPAIDPAHLPAKTPPSAWRPCLGELDPQRLYSLPQFAPAATRP